MPDETVIDRPSANGFLVADGLTTPTEDHWSVVVRIE